MKTYRLNSIMTGALYILGTVAGVLSVVTVGGFPDENSMNHIVADPWPFIPGAFLILIMGFSLAAMTIFIYPLFRKDSEPLAMGMVLFRGAFEGTWYILTALTWVTLSVLGKEIASSGVDSATLQTVGVIILQVSDKLGNIGTIAFIIGATCLYTSFYRTQLIPRWLSVWGLIVVAPYLAVDLFGFFGSTLSLDFLYAPLAIQEMVMGLWLVIKGFNMDALKKLDEAH
jgi:hypothetical protein